MSWLAQLAIVLVLYIMAERMLARVSRLVDADNETMRAVCDISKQQSGEIKQQLVNISQGMIEIQGGIVRIDTRLSDVEIRIRMTGKEDEIS
jgi:hypothetical protein